MKKEYNYIYYSREELEKKSLDELEDLFDGFLSFSNEYSHLLNEILEKKG